MPSSDIPHWDDVRSVPVLTDDQAVVLMRPLLTSAIRRQFWVLFLDEWACPLPLLMPMALPPRPGVLGPALGVFLAEMGRAEGASGVVVAFERLGGPEIRDADRPWLRAIHTACVSSGLAFRRPLLCHSFGVTSVPEGEYLSR
jgi:hypothetical protein